MYSIFSHNALLNEIYLQTKNELTRVDLSVRLESNLAYITTQTDLIRFKEGNVSAQFWSISANCSSTNALRIGLEQLDTLKRLTDQSQGNLTLVKSISDIRTAMKNGTISSIIAISGGHMIDNSVRVLRMYYMLGARSFALAHDQCVPSWANLSMNEFGMVCICVFSVLKTQSMYKN